MSWIAIVLVALVTIVIYFLFSKSQLPSDYPPGPPGLPFFGNVLSLYPNRYVAYQKWGRQYGDIFSVDLFSTRNVILHSIKAVREAFLDRSNTTSFRIDSRFVDVSTSGYGIVNTNGPQWQEHRRFALRNLRDLGFAKTLSVDAVHQEMLCFDEMMEKNGEKPVNVRMAFANMTANVISRTVFGSRLSHENSERERVMKLLMDYLVKATSIIENIPVYFPCLLDIPFFLTIYNKFSVRLPHFAEINRFLKSKLDEHIETIGDITEPRDYTDALILHRQSLEAQGQWDHTYNELSMLRELFDIFGAGTDTTSVTLTWGILAMALNPVIQEKMRKEILDEIGPEALPTLQDRSKLNYTLAAIDEMSRYGSILPTGLLHRANADTKICGYTVPKDTVIQVNIYAVHHDEKLWKNPDEFDPSNFLDDNGIYKSSDNLIPFSLGKRACMGESLARLELFVFFIALIQRYRVSLADIEKTNVKKLLMGTDGLVRHLIDHKIIFSRIKN